MIAVIDRDRFVALQLNRFQFNRHKPKQNEGKIKCEQKEARSFPISFRKSITRGLSIFFSLPLQTTVFIQTKPPRRYKIV